MEKLPEAQAHYMEYPRVTAVLEMLNKPHLYRWYAEMALKHGDVDAAIKFREKRAGEGSWVHKALEAHFKKEPFTPPKGVAGFVSAALDWARKYNAQMLKSEHPVWSDQHKYRGTTDGILLIEEHATLTDFKTVKDEKSLGYEPHREHRLQLEAYRHAYQEREGVWVPRVGIARFAPTGQFRWDMWDGDGAREFKIFLGLRDVYEWSRDWDRLHRRN